MVVVTVGMVMVGGRGLLFMSDKRAACTMMSSVSSRHCAIAKETTMRSNKMNDWDEVLWV